MTTATIRPLPDPVRKRVTVLGATGSVGRSTLDLVMRDRDRFAVDALVAQSNAVALAGQARAAGARLAVVTDERALPALRDALAGSGIEAAGGAEAAVAAADGDSDIVMAAIVGTAGLRPTLAAVRRGATVALANKECLVSAGSLFIAAVRKGGATLLPVDSEHNAIFQVLDETRMDSVERIILTASGGPFRTASREAMAAATPEQAVAHPNWSMGAKISIDSATMMNKGLELIEAHYLFPVGHERIEVLVHPQSVIHSMVAYVDGSVLAQLGAPDMRIPIAHALAWPDRITTPTARLDLARIATLTFEAPDPVRFPALRLAREALNIGPGAQTVLNAANEIAVQGFLNRNVGFLHICDIVEDVMTAAEGAWGRLGDRHSDLEAVLELDSLARRLAREAVAARSSG